MLTSSQRKFLRGEAHHRDALVLIGKFGVTESLIGAADAALEAHELLKVRFNDFKDQKDELVREIESKTNSELCGQIGHVAIFFRQHPDPEKQKIVLPK